MPQQAAYLAGYVQSLNADAGLVRYATAVAVLFPES